MIELDPQRDASHLRMIDHLAGPFAGGAVDTPVPLAGNEATVEWSAREPLLLCAARGPVGATGFSVSVQVTPSGGPVAPLVVLAFAPYSDAGGFLPVYRPDVDPTARTVAPFKVVVTVVGSTATAESLVELRLVEGVMGRFLFLLGAEKQRILRQAREIRAARELAVAKLAALDRYGYDLAVPRFGEALVYHAATADVTTVPYPDGREPDAEYRKRLAVFRGFQVASPDRALAALRTVKPTFTLGESDAEFAVAMKLVAPASSAERAEYLAFVRDVHLVDPRVATPANRFISTDERVAEDAMRARLRAAYDWSGAPNVAVAKALAETLDRVGRLRTALGITRPWNVLAPADPDGSRYELGLGVDLEAMPAAEVSALVAAAHTGSLAAGTDHETAALAHGLAPVADPNARWLLDAAGLKTVQPLAGSRVFLSHFPMHGMVIAATFTAAPTVALSAIYEAPGDPSRNAVLALALADTAAQWTGPAFAVLSPADHTAALGRVTAAPAPFLAAVHAVALRSPATTDAAALAVKNLRAVAPELVATVKLDAGQAAALLANAAGAATQLRTLVDRFGANGAVSVLATATTAGEVLLSVTETRQPGDAVVLDDTRVASYRWYTVPVGGDQAFGALRPRLGPRSVFTPSGSALTLAIAIGTARSGRLDPRGAVEPYTVRPELPAGDLLSFAEYERVMNLLDRLHPIGVVVNTTAIRNGRVDLDGDGAADPMPARLSRTFRPFRHKRHLGATGDILDE